LLSNLGHEVPTALLPRVINSLGVSAAVLGVIEGIADGLAGLARLEQLRDREVTPLNHRQLHQRLETLLGPGEPE